MSQIDVIALALAIIMGLIISYLVILIVASFLPQAKGESMLLGNKLCVFYTESLYKNASFDPGKQNKMVTECILL